MFNAFLIFCTCFLLFKSITKDESKKQIIINEQNSEFEINIVLSNNPSKKKIRNMDYFYFHGILDYRLFKENNANKDFYLLYKGQKYNIYIDSMATVIPLWQQSSLEIGKKYQSEVYIVFKSKNIDFEKVKVIFESNNYVNSK